MVPVKIFLENEKGFFYIQKVCSVMENGFCENVFKKSKRFYMEKVCSVIENGSCENILENEKDFLHLKGLQ
jgi:hypothetical protein